MKTSMVFTALLTASSVLAQDVRINEIRIDQDGSDNDEYFELIGPPGTNLSDLTYIVIGDGSGGSGVIESITPLTSTISASGYYVVAESTWGGDDAVVDETGSLNFENGDNVTHLLVRDFTGSSQDDIDTDDDGVLDSTPWSEIVSCIALLEEVGAGDLVYCDETVGPDGTFVPGHVYKCDSGWQIGAFVLEDGDDTPGEGNPCDDPPPPVVATINEIRIDQDGSDNDEYFELIGTAGDSLDGLTYIVIGDGSGGSGVIESITPLTGTISASGYYVVAESTWGGDDAVVDETGSLNFENGDNVTHLLVRDFTGTDQEDLDTDDDGVLDSTPWSEIVSCIALLEEVGAGDLVYCDETVGPDGTFVPAHAYKCDSGWQIGAFVLEDGDDTPGEDNDCSPQGEFETYCVAFPNSVSVDGAQIGWTGTGNISDNDTVLTVSDCPDNWGLFFFGNAEDLVIPFGNGALCVDSGSLTRLPVSKASGNENSYALDFDGSGPEASFMVGDTKYIQYWYRDAGQGAQNNTSNALKATFGG